MTVAPVRERGLKWLSCYRRLSFYRRSRKGAWIEIGITNWYDPAPRVAPVRERGLKCSGYHWRRSCVDRRSRKGAWIEIYRYTSARIRERGRSRKGAWIEIS